MVTLVTPVEKKTENVLDMEGFIRLFSGQPETGSCFEVLTIVPYANYERMRMYWTNYKSMICF